MGWTTFELTDVTTQKTSEYEMPHSAPAPIVQDAKEIMVGDTKGGLNKEGEAEIRGNVAAENLLKAADHIVKKTLGMESFPRDNELEYEKLDGVSLQKLKDHYLEVDLKGKNSNGSNGEQSSSEKQ